MVGQTPHVKAKFGGKEINCLIDTGSMVSTMSETFFNQHLKSTCSDPVDTTSWLVVKAANGLDIPYIGYVELDVEYEGQVVPSRAILIERDIAGLAEKKRFAPGCIGMNILREVPEFKKIFGASIEAGKYSSTIEINNDKTRFARVAGTSPVIVPASSICNIPATGNKMSKHMLLEPLTHPLPGGLLVGKALVSARSGRIEVPIINPTDFDVLLKTRTPVGTISSVDLVEPTDVQFTVTKSEILVAPAAGLDQDMSPESVGWIAEHMDMPELCKDQERRIHEVLAKYSTVFARSEEDLGLTNVIKHHIPTVDDHPISQPYRRIPPNQLQEVKDHIRQMIRRNIIRESTSPYASPMVLVRKKSGKLRICIDYRKLNSKTRRDAFPLPRIEESLDALGGATLFSTIDLQSAYNQVEVMEADKPKTAFSSPMGLFEYNRMPFGLSNAPATFQRLMNTIFREDLHEKLLVYLDDIVIHSKTFEEHVQRLELVLSRLAKYGLRVEPAKCHLFRPQVKFLGHVISKHGIATDPDLVSTVRDWPVPKDAKELRSFLGTAGYYRRYVKNFTLIASPLHQLVNQDPAKGQKQGRGKPKAVTGKPKQPFQWSKEADEAFSKLKQLLISAPILGYADFTVPFYLETDACSTGLGAVLYQKQQGQDRVIAYASRGLRGSERNSANYSSMKLELLALKWAVCDKFRDYLIGSPFTIFTDNNPLCYLQTTAKLGAMEQRWASQLAQFNFDIRYRPGKENGSADGLSRKIQDPPSSSAEELDIRCGMMLIPNELQAKILQQTIVSVNAQEIEVPGAGQPPTDMLGTMDRAQLILDQREDPVLSRVWYYMDQSIQPSRKQMKAEPREFKLLARSWAKIQIIDDLLYRVTGDDTKQLLVPAKLRETVLMLMHDRLGHQGVDRTAKLPAVAATGHA